MHDPLKILIVDDTVVYRQILSSVITGIGDVEITGTAPNGRIALAKMEQARPDLVLLDVSMPEMDGIEALEHIRRLYPAVDVIMVSGVDVGNAEMTMRALDLGALDFVPKPQGGSTVASLSSLREQLLPLISLVRTRVYARRTRDAGAVTATPPAVKTPRPAAVSTTGTSGGTASERPSSGSRVRRARHIEVIALGISTGGPNALQTLVPGIITPLPVPILAVQHMPPMFTASLADRLDKLSRIRVVEGADGMPVERDVMYIAPGGRHMVVRTGGDGARTIGILDTPPVKSCRPSADVLFRSIAMSYGGNVLSVIMTGMGDDGADGVGMLRSGGGYSVVQDAATSVVWGMPGAVHRAGNADETAPLGAMARRLIELTS